MAVSKDETYADYIGGSEIVLKNGLTEVVSKINLYFLNNIKIYTFDLPGEATSIIIRRVVEGNNSRLILNHMRVYQSKNLL